MATGPMRYARSTTETLLGLGPNSGDTHSDNEKFRPDTEKFRSDGVMKDLNDRQERVKHFHSPIHPFIALSGRNFSWSRWNVSLSEGIFSPFGPRPSNTICKSLERLGSAFGGSHRSQRQSRRSQVHCICRCAS
jgi:hypothetical protein